MRKLREPMISSRSYSKDVMEPGPRPVLLTPNTKPLANNWILPSSMQQKQSPGCSNGLWSFWRASWWEFLSHCTGVSALGSLLHLGIYILLRICYNFGSRGPTEIIRVGGGRRASWNDSMLDVSFLQGILPSGGFWDRGIFCLLAYF